MARRRDKRLAGGLAVTAFWLLALLPLQAQTPTVPVVVRMAPGLLQVPENATSDVAVEVVDVEELYGFDVTVTFDPQVVEVVDADPNLPGTQVTQGLFLDPGFAVVNEADNVSGTVHFVMTQLNPSEAKSGTGALIVIKLLGKLAGSAGTLGMSSIQLARRDGFMIPATGVSGQVEVVAAGGATNTPMPTQGAGTPMATTTPEPTLPPATATAYSATATSVMATVTALVATTTAMPAATTVPTVALAPGDTPVPVGSPSDAAPTAAPEPGASQPPEPAAAGEASATPVAMVAPATGAQGQVATLAVPSGTGAAPQRSGRDKLAAAALWVAVVAGSLAAGAGLAVMLLWLRTRRKEPK